MAYVSGADLFGVADISQVLNYTRKMGGDLVARYPTAVVAGIRLNDDIVDRLTEGDPRDLILYRHNSYDVVNQMLDQVGVRIAQELVNAGHHALPVPASKRTDEITLSCFFSHKLAAHLAGLESVRTASSSRPNSARGSDG